MRIFDANAILRYILNDNKEMADKTAEYISKGNILILNEVIAEVVFVLSGKIYQISRERIRDSLIEFLNEVYSQDKNLIKALEIYAETKLDFVDSLLCAYSANHEIVTFDKKLLKYIEKEDL